MKKGSHRKKLRQGHGAGVIGEEQEWTGNNMKEATL